MAPTIVLNASEHPIKAVTVFSSRKAEVIRTFSVDLEEGQNEINIISLPSGIDTETARITGLGDAVLFDVVCTVQGNLFGPSPPYCAQYPELWALERKLAALQGQKTLYGHTADMLVNYGHSLRPENSSLDVLSSFFDTLALRGEQTLEAAAELDRQIAAVQQEIYEEQVRLREKSSRGATKGRVSAVVMAKLAGKVDITLSYMVFGATWSPSYDLKATTEGGEPPRSVLLHYRAAIQQNTGEDWRDTAISVSTATPGTWATIPGLRAVRIVPAAADETFASYMKSNKNAGFFVKRASQQNQSAPQQNPNVAFPWANNVQHEHQLFEPRNSLFGGTSNSAAPSSTGATFGGGGGFRAFGQSNGANPAAAGGLFGSSTSASMPPAPGLFGTAPANPNPVPFHVFGTTAPATTATPADAADSWTTVEAPGAEQPAALGPAGDEGEDTLEPSGWAESKTVVSESAVSSAFRIEGNSTIPSDGTQHKVAIAVLMFSAKVNYVAVPRTTPVAYLQGEITNSSEYRLLPGLVNVYLDNTPVSKTHITDVNPDEKFKCTFGPDPSLRIKCTRIPRTVSSAGSQFAAQSTTATYKLLTSIFNTHSFAIRGLVVRDAVPVPAADQGTEQTAVDSGIKVVLKRPQGLSDAAVGELLEVKDKSAAIFPSAVSSVKVRWARENGNKDGKYEWVVDIGAGEEVKLEAEYDVRAPSDFKWTLREEYYRE